MRKFKNRYFYYIFVSPRDAPGAITLSVVWMKKNSMLTNCLAECAHLTITVSEIDRYIGRKSSFFSYPFAFDPPLRGFPSEHRHSVEWLGYPMVKKIRRFLYSFWRNSQTWQTHRRTPGDGNSRAMHSIARQKFCESLMLVQDHWK